MATVIRVKLSQLLRALLLRLQQVSGLGPECVFCDQRDDSELEEAPSQADQFYVVRVQTSTSTDNYIGSSRLDMRQTRTVKITAWSRLALDEPGRDTERLTNLSFSHLDLEHDLWDALGEFYAEDSAGNWLQTHPWEPRGADVPRRGKIDPYWLRSAVAFEIPYVLDVDQTLQ